MPRTFFVALLGGLLGLALPAGAVAPPPDAEATKILDELAGSFPRTKFWFSLVEEMSLHTDASGAIRPDWDTAAHHRIVRADITGRRLLPVAPSRADLPFRVGIERVPDFWIEATSPGAAAVPVRVARGMVVYPGAMPAGDLLYKMTPTHVDEYLLVREPRDFIEMRYELVLGPGVWTTIVTDDGIDFLDREGVARIRMNPPLARDSRDARRDGTLTLEGNTAVVRVDLIGLEFPVLVDPDWEVTAFMPIAGRFLFKSYTMPNGDILSAGGCAWMACPNAVPHPSCVDTIAEVELFNPATYLWTATVDPMAEARYAYAASDLPNDRFLVAGGCAAAPAGMSDDGCTFQTAGAEVFSAATGTWTSAGALSIAMAYVEAVRVSDTEVMMIGGCGSTVCATNSDVYNSVTGTWSTRAGLATPRALHTVTKLPDGRILVTGGCDSLACDNVLSTTEVYNPQSDSWSPSVSMTGPRVGHIATLLGDGSVLISGGCTNAACDTVLNTATRWVDGTFVPIASMADPRHHHTATLAPDGRVFAVGGCVATGTFGPICTEAAEVWDPAVDQWNGIEAVPTYFSVGRGYHDAVLLPDGNLMVIGGCNEGTCLRDAVLYCTGAGGDCSPQVVLPAPFCNCRVGVSSAPGTLTAPGIFVALAIMSLMSRAYARRKKGPR